MSDNDEIKLRPSNRGARSKGAGKAAGMIALGFIVLFFGALLFSWLWNTFRVYVPEGYMAVVTAKSGKEPAVQSYLRRIHRRYVRH